MRFSTSKFSKYEEITLKAVAPGIIVACIGFKLPQIFSTALSIWIYDRLLPLVLILTILLWIWYYIKITIRDPSYIEWEAGNDYLAMIFENQDSVNLPISDIRTIEHWAPDRKRQWLKLFKQDGSVIEINFDQDVAGELSSRFKESGIRIEFKSREWIRKNKDNDPL